MKFDFEKLYWEESNLLFKLKYRDDDEFENLAHFSKTEYAFYVSSNRTSNFHYKPLLQYLSSCIQRFISTGNPMPKKEKQKVENEPRFTFDEWNKKFSEFINGMREES